MKTMSILIAITLLSGFHNVEADTFGRMYRQHGTIYSVQETQDGGFILGTDKGIIKTNSDGRAEWQILHGRSRVIQLTDGSYISVYRKNLPGPDWFGLQIAHFSIDGELVLDKTLLEYDDFKVFEFERTMGGGYIIQIETKSKVNSLVKTDSFFELEWQSEFPSAGSFLREPHFTQTTDSGFLAIGVNGELTKFDAHGDTLWTNFDLSQNYYLVAELNNSNLLLFSYERVGLFTEDGELIKEDTLAQGYNKKVIIDEQNEYMYLLSDDLIRKMDLEYNILSTNSVMDLHEDFILNNNNFAYVVGQHKGKAFFVKPDIDGNFNYLALAMPNDEKNLQIMYPVTVRWFSNLSGNINLKYSIDNGQNWNNIVSNYPVQEERYTWTTPGIQTDQLLLKIELSDDPSWYDQHDFPLSLIRKSYDFITTDQVLMWFGNNGDGSHNPINNGSGYYWPGGINALESAIFADGLCWGGLVNGSVRVSGSTHRHGLRPGNILADGGPADPEDARFGIWRANKNWQILAPGSEKDRLQYDWNNWPVNLGAPWEDNDGNGEYDPQTDNPIVTGDDFFWMVMNDLDTVSAHHMYGTDPIGLEVQLSVYAYNRDILENVIFKKYKILNKGANTVDSMYFSYWSDPDLGGAGDDFVGCDPQLDLAYCYNDDEDDSIYNFPLPAVGYVLLQGPIVPGDVSDEAFAFNSWIRGKKNLAMSSFMPFISFDVFRDPTPGTSDGAREYYNYMTGKNIDANDIYDPLSGQQTNFALSGDPDAHAGWYEGDGWPDGPRSGDRRMAMNSGPLNFAPGDKQEIVIAVVIARGNNHLDSITELKKVARAVREFYYTGEIPTNIENENITQIPQKFSLQQNYPNPFNPETIINYELRITNFVKLIVYDALGRVVQTLVDKKQPAGTYQVTFDAENLSSGVYYYKLVVGETFKKTKKMLLLK